MVNREKASSNRLAFRLLVILPPVLFILYVGHSFTVIRELLSESTDFHLNYANNLVQEYFESELNLQIERLNTCFNQDHDTCPDTHWLKRDGSGQPIATLARDDQSQMQVYLSPDDIGGAIGGFVEEKKGLEGLITSRHHEPVYWFQIRNAQGESVYQSGPALTAAKGRKAYPMGQALPGYELDIAYNSFGAQQLYSVASKRINFAAIFFLFVLAVLSLVLFTRSVRQKILLAKQKTFFVSTVSHEFKTPLAVMKLASETLSSKRYSSQAEADRFLRMIANEINHLNHLVHKILSYNKIEMNQIYFHNQTLDLIELLKTSRENYAIRAEAENVQLVWTMPAGPCFIQGDSDLIRHAVDNVLDNAFKYRGTSRTIEVACEITEQTATLRIRDEGVGIAADEQKHIFKSFYRVSDPSTEGIRGSGLGLAVSRYILNRSQAKLQVSSMLGKGSTFTIQFPLRREAAA